MKAYGIAIADGANISNLVVASGTSFPSLPDNGELFYRSDAATTVRGLYLYVGGAWDRIASADSVTVPSGTNFPASANAGDLFYKNSNDGAEGLYAYNDTSWVAVASGTLPSYTITGDVTGTIDGAPDVLTLATVNSNVGSFGNASSTLILTTNAKGLVTAASSSAINIDAAQVVSGTFANSRISQASVTQYQGNLVLSTSQTTSGTFADARISQSSITQHQAALTILESQITDGALLARNAGNETISGNWTFSTPVTGAEPLTSSHLTTKNYVDNVALGLVWKRPARVATVVNITLSGAQTIDGIALVAGDRVLVKNQTTTADNGVYVVAAGTWTRAVDFDQTAPIDEVNSAAIFVTSGSTQSDTGWTQTAPVATVGVDAMVFVQFSAAGSFVAGAGVTLTGNVLDVNTASSLRIVVNADSIDLAAVGTPVTAAFVKPTTDVYGRVSATTPVVAGDITGALGYTPGTGSVTSISVVTANGFSGTVANATTTPAITIATSVTGVVKGTGTALVAATAGVDYSAGTSALATGILKSTTGTGALTIAVAGDFPVLNQNTTGSAATLTTPRTINGVAFDGSANITVAAAAATLTSTSVVRK